MLRKKFTDRNVIVGGWKDWIVFVLAYALLIAVGNYVVMPFVFWLSAITENVL